MITLTPADSPEITDPEVEAVIHAARCWARMEARLSMKQTWTDAWRRANRAFRGADDGEDRTAAAVEALRLAVLGPMEGTIK
jgi:hypothetical protein